MEIRQAKSSDYDSIYQFVKTVFETAQVSDGNEQEFVYELRARDGFIPELELVMEDEQELIGHILFTKQIVKGTEGDKEALLLAPLSVQLEYRNRGCGGRLIHAGFEKAKQLGFTAVFLVGNPDYYGRFGFQSTEKYGIVNATEIPDQYVLACELIPGALNHIGGSVYIA